eukprot:3173606-Pleurochrysis_carterae.AAC.1
MRARETRARESRGRSHRREVSTRVKAAREGGQDSARAGAREGAREDTRALRRSERLLMRSSSSSGPPSAETDCTKFMLSGTCHAMRCHADVAVQSDLAGEQRVGTKRVERVALPNKSLPSRQSTNQLRRDAQRVTGAAAQAEHARARPEQASGYARRAHAQRGSRRREGPSVAAPQRRVTRRSDDAHRLFHGLRRLRLACFSACERIPQQCELARVGRQGCAQNACSGRDSSCADSNTPVHLMSGFKSAATRSQGADFGDACDARRGKDREQQGVRCELAVGCVRSLGGKVSVRSSFYATVATIWRQRWPWYRWLPGHCDWSSRAFRRWQDQE